VLIEDRAFRGEGGVGVRDRESLCAGSGGGHSGLFVESELG
jgi:hypothetical protein